MPVSPSQDRDRLRDCRISPWLAQFLYWFAQRIFLPLYFGPIRVSGQENLPKTGPMILAPTHRSRWDAIMVCFVAGRSITGDDVHFMVSADETRGLQGWFVRRLGGFPVDTRRPGIASLRHGIELLQQGRILTIFPEGDIFRDGTLHPLKPGLARMAAYTLETGASDEHSDEHIDDIAVLPISFDYGAGGPRFGSTITIDIGQPISSRTCQGGSTKATSRKIISQLYQGFEQLGVRSPAANEMPMSVA
ncbi:MAG: lysophospholipid acyltransferase family protein [Cyanobacteria bacterium P01_C01_bin.89]